MQERSKFAQVCRKNNGFFKCCLNANTLHPIEETRNRLIHDGFIDDKITGYCNDPGEKQPDRCMLCMADGVCTVKKISGIHQIFMYKYKKEHRVSLIIFKHCG